MNKPRLLSQVLRLAMLLLAALLVAGNSARARCAAISKSRPAVLLVTSAEKLDYDYLTQLHEQGFQIDTLVAGGHRQRQLDWELLRRYNCVLFEDLPLGNGETRSTHWGWEGPPWREGVQSLLDRYFEAGGGVLILANIKSYADTLAQLHNFERYLEPWGARLPLESIHDPATETKHPRSPIRLIRAEAAPDTPVSEGVERVWFPVGPLSGHFFQQPGNPIEVSGAWQVVLRGGPTSFTKDREAPNLSGSAEGLEAVYHRPDQQSPPALMAIRPMGNGRLALGAMWSIFHITGGTRWVHDSVVLDKGLHGQPSHFSQLLENTLGWLAEPSLASGTLGGYQQDPAVLKHPNKRRPPEEFFASDQVVNQPRASGTPYRGLIGARTSYSKATGSVADYAAAARETGLDFVVFLEDFCVIDEATYRKLEDDCRRHSDDDLQLVPGFTMRTNIGNPIFFTGFDGAWPQGDQLGGPEGKQLRLQNFDGDGKLDYSDEKAKNLLWDYAIKTGDSARNIGYFDFGDGAGVPVRNLRLVGIIGVLTYRNGELVEDITEQYRDYTADGNPPLACAINRVDSPEQLVEAVRSGQTLTHASLPELSRLRTALVYGHQYGRANVYPSAGPEILAWATTYRVQTYAGEPFVTARYRVRPKLHVRSDTGLAEIVVYSEQRPYRRILLNGAEQFEHTFEWAYDRHRVLTVEAIDVEGRRAVSAGLEIWCDGNYNGWCHDRQNGELWHGPFTFPGPRWPTFSQGPTWDGGGHESFIGLYLRCQPVLATTSGQAEGDGRLMEGNMWPVCYDDCCANVAGVAEHVYAPGVVANAYHTLGPIEPSRLMRVELRRTQYLHRAAGVNLDWHPMYPEREGGNLALIEGAVTLKQDAEIRNLAVARLRPEHFNPEGGNVPIWVVRTDDESTPICGSGNTLCKHYRIPPDAGLPYRSSYPIAPGGYVGLFATELGNNSLIANLGQQDLVFEPYGHWELDLKPEPPQGKAGERFRFRYLVIYDSMAREARNLARFERLRSYFGLDGSKGSRIDVRRGALASHFGLVDLKPAEGAVEFIVPRPEFVLDLPLGLRVVELNPNWTAGQLMLEGYTTGYYTSGKGVWRNLAVDDHGIVHVSLFPDRVARSHSVVGHPVVCDNPELRIQFTRLSDEPRYYVAVNNPTDRPIETTLRKGIDLPGFELPGKPIAVAPGALRVVVDGRGAPEQ